MLILIIFFISGLIVGSFLNVVVYRLRLMESMMGRSYCPHCKHKIHWYDNIPLLSFVLLGAKCRSCEESISWQYPIVELLSGVTFAFVARCFLAIGSVATYWEVFFYIVIFSLLLVLLAYDWKFMEVPIVIFWIILAVAVVYFGFSDVLDYFYKGVALSSLKVTSGLVGGFIAWALFFALVFFSKEKWMGWGDVYVGSLAGFILGWPNILIGLVLSFTIGAVYAVVVIIKGNKNMKSQIPFIPFLSAGVIITVFLCKLMPSLNYYFYF